MKKVLFICGSLRRDGFNMQLLRLASERLPASCSCSFLSYGDLPLLDQDKEFPAPAAVARVRAEVAGADALWIGSPEYNHSYSAALKNLVDWLSRPVEPGDYSTAAGRGKLVVISSAAGASGGAFSLAKLRELLVMLGCTVLEEETRIPLGKRFGQTALALLPEEEAMLERECSALIARLAD